MSSTRLLAACAALAGLALAGAPPASAVPATAHFSSCPDFALEAELQGMAFSMCFSTRVTPSGRAVADVHGELLPGVTPPRRAVTVRDFGCMVAYPSSDALASASRLVITPDGRVNGSCKL